MGSVVRATLKRSSFSVCALQRSHQYHGSLLQVKCFSTEAEQPPPRDSTPTPPPQFLRTDDSGLTYGMLLGAHRYMLKTDVIHFLEGSNLTLEDVRVKYSRSYIPQAMMLQFPTRNSYDNAVRVIARKGRLYKLERADQSQWDIVTPYDGRSILIQGLPRNASFEEVERTLSGCEYDPTSMNIFLRGGDGTEPIRMATVRFPSRTQAMNAFILKNGTFCQNNRILIQVLQ